MVDADIIQIIESTITSLSPSISKHYQALPFTIRIIRSSDLVLATWAGHEFTAKKTHSPTVDTPRRDSPKEAYAYLRGT